jgi:hypothetical protein
MARRLQGEKGDNMADYEQVTQDVREGLSRIAANKGNKPVEIIMKEILEVLTAACEQHNVNKFEFIQAFYEWYKEKLNWAMASSCSLFTVRGRCSFLLRGRFGPNVAASCDLRGATTYRSLPSLTQ